MKEFQVFYVPGGCACDSEWVYLGTVRSASEQEALAEASSAYKQIPCELVCIASIVQQRKDQQLCQ